MNEIILQVMRTIACKVRLQILSMLAKDREIAPTVLARDLRISLPMVCGHLRRLASAGLIQRRRSAAWCYSVAESPYDQRAFSGKVASWLFAILAGPKQTLEHCGVSQLRDLSLSEAESRLHSLIFEAATAFANIRRLEILRRLSRDGAATAKTLASELSMSESAVSRHASKLVRRGYVTASRSEHCLIYQPTEKAKTVIHEQMLEYVRAEWDRKLLRS
ncbi:MAG: helix-turn-helix domain-containing protein [Verrucomicrobia bacterium]|nr:helix-turn-helix domain-containing protein [Verrucomicrobiota bacterium]